MDAHRVEELAEELGLGEIAAELAALSSMGWRLVYDGPLAPAPLGASKLGGTPDLPPGVEWPRSGRDGTPTAFIGQLAVADFDGAITWPGRDRDLLLSFFCDLDPDAVYAEGPGAGIVLAHRVGAGLRRHPRPDDLIEVRALRELVVHGMPERSLPNIGVYPGEPLVALGLDWEGARAGSMGVYEELLWRMGREQGLTGAPLSPRSVHRLLGATSHQQGDAVHGFARQHRNRFPRATDEDVRALDDAAFERWRQGDEQATVREAAHWRLLLQVQSDVDHLGVQWGTLYFGIREDDLAADRFDRVEAFSDSD